MTVRSVLILFAALLLAGCGGPLEVTGITQDDAEFERFPQVMRAFPVWQATTPPVYDFETRDGARKPSGGLRYTSSLSAAELADRFAAHAATIGCDVTLAEPARLLADCGGSSARGLELHLDGTAGSARQVVVLFLGTTPDFETVSF